jgi:rare lipoprotein A
VLAGIALLLAGCGGTAVFRGEPEIDPGGRDVRKGVASYYHDSLQGNPTASGEPYDRNALTAAHRSLPFGTEILVRNLENGRTVRVRVNDRGPFVSGRIVDLSRRAAEELGFVRNGVADVAIEVVGP